MESLKKINNLTLHSVTGKVDNSFIGIKIKNSLIDFYFPETYDIAEEHDIVNLRNDIFAILRTISLAKTFTESNDKVENKFSINGQFALMSYLWIINDYLTNGIYVNREKTLKINQKLNDIIKEESEDNQSLAMKINEMVSLDKIQEVSSELGLTYNNENIKSVTE